MRRHTLRRTSTFTLAAGIAAGSAICALSQPSWAVAPLTAHGSASGKLHSVSASSPTDAWAVGWRQAAPGENTLAVTKHWDGSRWRIVQSAHPGEYSYLWGVADVSPSDAWAVGETLGGATILPFAEHWNGSDWQIVPLNAPGLGELNAVSANGSDDVWMVGTGYPGAFEYPHAFIAHWDGSRISRVKPAKLTKARSNELTGIAAIAADDVWAVGEHGRQSSTYLPLIEHYDGSSWSVVAGDPAVGETANLAGVDGTSAHDAWAVGWNALAGDPAGSAMAEHWDGKEWTISQVATPGYSSYLTSVSVVAVDDVWAVGTWARTQQNQRGLPLIEHWDGDTWSIVAAPPPGHQRGAYVESVSMATADDGFAVGEISSSTHSTPYAIRWDGSAWGDER